MLRVGQLAVTTSRKVNAVRRTYARERAEQWGIPFIERHDRSMRDVVSSYDAVLVFGDGEVRLADHAGDLAFHPGMAHRRISRLRHGESDMLVEIAELRPGQHVVDATLGLGRDALVAAKVVGHGGAVVGLEASAVLVAFTEEGLRDCTDEFGLGRIRVEHVDALSWLRNGDQRYDLVMLDPMFSRPKAAEPGFELLRRHAVDIPLSDDLIEAAVRRARRVVVKVGGRAALRAVSRRPDVVRTTRSLTWARFDTSG